MKHKIGLIKSVFIDELKIEQKSEAKNCINLIKYKKIRIEELSEEQKQEVLTFLEEEIVKENTILQNLKNKILYKRLKNEGNISTVLSKISQDDKTNFLNFLKQLNYKV